MIDKKRAMSNLGYAIVLVIILGIVMIVSAPMLVNKQKAKFSNPNNNYQENRDYSEPSAVPDANYSENNENSSTSSDELRAFEDRINSRLNDIEIRQQQNQSSNSKTISNKYVCSIEGMVDANNNVVSVEGQSSEDLKKQKIVFVCEYRE